jgi:hypothetical protein
MKPNIMKTITCAVIIILVAATTSCEESIASPPKKPPGPDPVQVLEKQVATERQLRTEAEGRVKKEAAARDLWQLAALGLGVVTMFAFIGGTAIGTRGRHHASVTS